MKQQWITVADVLPKTVAESDVQIHVQQLTAAGIPALYLDTVNYPRLVLYSTTPPPVPTPTPEGSWVVFVGPFPNQSDADVQCNGEMLDKSDCFNPDVFKSCESCYERCGDSCMGQGACPEKYACPGD